MEIPYTVSARSDTGLWNAKIGVLALFLASEVMLFGGLFSGYVFLRLGADYPWPHGELNVPLGFINTIILILSSVFVVMAWASLQDARIPELREVDDGGCALRVDLPGEQGFQPREVHAQNCSVPRSLRGCRASSGRTFRRHPVQGEVCDGGFRHWEPPVSQVQTTMCVSWGRTARRRSGASGFSATGKLAGLKAKADYLGGEASRFIGG